MTLVIYGDLRSGNCLKVKWTADRLGLAYDWVDVDILAGDTRSPEFTALNPAAQAPTVLLEDGRTLAQSNAIMLHLGRDTDLIPEDPFWRAKMLEWLFWEQSSHAPYLAGRRRAKLLQGLPEARIDRELKPRGEAALAQMESWLKASPYLVDGRLTLADVALLPYTRWAHEGGFDLERFAAVRQWIARVETDLGLARAEAFAAA